MCTLAITKNEINSCTHAYTHSLAHSLTYHFHFDWWVGGMAWVCGKWKTATSFFCYKIYHTNSSYLIFYFHFCICVDFSIHFDSNANIFLRSLCIVCVCVTVKMKKMKWKETPNTNDMVLNVKSSMFLLVCTEASLTFHHLDETKENSTERKKTYAQCTRHIHLFMFQNIFFALYFVTCVYLFYLCYSSHFSHIYLLIWQKCEHEQ